MNKKIITAALIGSAILAFAGGKKDPVLMTIDGKDVKLSEFEYLYHKNNSQQQAPISFDEYVGMFVDYKLKVADAIALGVDTTAKFVAEYRKFNNDLATPYLRDSATTERLVREAYSHLGKEVEVSHIMLARDEKGTNNAQRLDSIRHLILSGEISFEDAAKKYSIDTRSARRGGRMGWIKAGVVPYPFEEVAYSTPVGQVSDVVNSGFGFHIIKTLDSRPDPGEVNAAHILRLTQGRSPEECEAQKALIDSIYALAAAGADFADLAKRYSEDPGSARNGGDLGWFGKGRMVAEFDSISFALRENELSKPFSTSYGYHIILKKDERGAQVPPLDEARAVIMRQMENDNRHQMPIDVTLDRLAAQSKSKVNAALDSDVNAYIAKMGFTAFDSATIATMAECPVLAYTVDGKKTTVGTVLKRSRLMPGNGLPALVAAVNDKSRASFRAAMLEYAREYTYKNNAEYRNLANEYRDGILLFEVANDKVWERATKDTDGLNAFFLANKDKYAWDNPRFKSYVIFATNDSIHSLVRSYTDSLDPATVSPTEFTKDLKAKFGADVRVERVIAAKGENAITDYLAFDGKKPDTKNSRWKHYYAFGSKMLNAPEEVADVRGIVVSDYQSSLEKKWLEELHKTYKVKINTKVLNQAK